VGVGVYENAAYEPLDHAVPEVEGLHLLMSGLLDGDVLANPTTGGKVLDWLESLPKMGE
jgi:hypothetical protein